MSHPTFAVLVRFASELDETQIRRVMIDRAPGFRALDGLEQKYYLKDPETGDYGGLYLWRSVEDLDHYRTTDLAATIASAYRTVGAPDVQVFEIMMPVRD